MMDNGRIGPEHWWSYIEQNDNTCLRIIHCLRLPYVHLSHLVNIPTDIMYLDVPDISYEARVFIKYTRFSKRGCAFFLPPLLNAGSRQDLIGTRRIVLVYSNSDVQAEMLRDLSESFRHYISGRLSIWTGSKELGARQKRSLQRPRKRNPNPSPTHASRSPRSYGKSSCCRACVGQHMCALLADRTTTTSSWPSAPCNPILTAMVRLHSSQKVLLQGRSISVFWKPRRSKIRRSLATDFRLFRNLCDSLSSLQIQAMIDPI